MPSPTDDRADAADDAAHELALGDDLRAFVDASPSPSHAVAEMARRLTGAGFTELAEADRWDPGYKTVFGKRFEIPAYGRLDLRAGVRSGRWTLEAFAKNVTGSTGLIDVNTYGAQPNGALLVAPLRPRTVGASLTANF